MRCLYSARSTVLELQLPETADLAQRHTKTHTDTTLKVLVVLYGTAAVGPQFAHEIERNCDASAENFFMPLSQRQRKLV